MDEGALADPRVAAMLEALYEAFPAATLVYDRNDQLVHAGGQVEALLPVPEDLLVPGTRIRKILCALFDNLEQHGRLKGRTQRLITRERWLAERTAFLWKERAEYLEQREGGRRVRYLLRRLPNGYGVCIIRDVTEKKRREEQWRVDSERVEITEQVLDELPFPVCVKSSSLVYVGVNRAFCRIIGRAREDILGRAPTELFADAVADHLEEADREILGNGVPVTSQELLVGADGREVKVVVRKFRVGNPGRYHVVTAMEDISALAAEGLDFVTLSTARRPLPVQEESSLQVIGGRNVLVVTTDRATAAASVESLSHVHAEASVVAGAEELELFLSIAHEANVRIDLVLIDDELASSCAAVAEGFQVPAVVVGRSRIKSDTGTLVADIFGRGAAESTASGEVTQAEDLIDVLVAEDNAVNQIVFSQILEGFGYRYAIAANGVDAVRLWRERSPRLVLMDITLPEMNGFEACRRIRELEERRRPTPVIGVLSHPFDRDREQCFASGMDDVILKPISPEMLETVFLAHMHEREAAYAR